jgi:hypothetical protein
LDIQFIDTDGKVYDVTLHDGLKWV